MLTRVLLVILVCSCKWTYDALTAVTILGHVPPAISLYCHIPHATIDVNLPLRNVLAAMDPYMTHCSHTEVSAIRVAGPACSVHIACIEAAAGRMTCSRILRVVAHHRGPCCFARRLRAWVQQRR